MQTAGVIVGILAFRGMELNNNLLRLPKQVFYFAHKLPRRASFIAFERHADMLPAFAVACDATDKPAVQHESEHPILRACKSSNVIGISQSPLQTGHSIHVSFGKSV
jgi:hypothetical protein